MLRIMSRGIIQRLLIVYAVMISLVMTNHPIEAMTIVLKRTAMDDLKDF